MYSRCADENGLRITLEVILCKERLWLVRLVILHEVVENILLGLRVLLLISTTPTRFPNYDTYLQPLLNQTPRKFLKTRNFL